MCKVLDKIVAKGEARGEARGKISAVYNFIKQGLITIEQAAKYINKSVQELLDGFKEYNLV